MNDGSEAAKKAGEWLPVLNGVGSPTLCASKVSALSMVYFVTRDKLYAARS